MDEPAQIGRYRVQGVLGRGAMGVIYKAHDPDIDRDVAIKLIRADLLGSEERADYLARFRREAQAAGRCMHPNIVGIYDFALHEGNPFLAMEFVEGVSLAQALERGTRFTWPEAVGVVLQVLEALACAHGLGVIHRDIKPANVLLPASGRVKVTDFGISRIESAGLTQAGTVIGTPSYMSPEQCTGGEVDRRSDLFSTGTLLFELLSGERPLPGRNFSEVMNRLLTEDPPDLRVRHPEIPVALAACVRRALAKPVGDRYASAEAMAEALRASLQSAAPAEATVVLGSAGSRPAAAPIDAALLGTIERKLAHYVGPIAKLLVSSAVSRAPSLEALCDTLATNIAPAEDRQAFLVSALRDTGLHTAQLAASGIPAEAAALAQQELTRYLGPIARVLVRRTAEKSRSPQDLWDKLATHIERDADRAAFLARRPRS